MNWAVVIVWIDNSWRIKPQEEAGSKDSGAPMTTTRSRQVPGNQSARKILIVGF